MPPRAHLTAIHLVNPAVSEPETPRSRSVSPMHTPLSHTSLADCVAPTHNAPQGTNCGSISCIECILRDSDTPGPHRFRPPDFHNSDGGFRSDKANYGCANRYFPPDFQNSDDDGDFRSDRANCGCANWAFPPRFPNI